MGWYLVGEGGDEDPRQGDVRGVMRKTSEKIQKARQLG